MSVMGQQSLGTIVSGERMTPFGAVENAHVLEALPATGFVKVDMLACLKELWGENILMSRPHLYALVSGNLEDRYFQEIMASYYKRYAAFANYVDEKYLFEDVSIPLIVRIIQPVRDMISSYRARVLKVVQQYGCKYLGENCDYLYFTYSLESKLPLDEVCYL